MANPRAETYHHEPREKEWDFSPLQGIVPLALAGGVVLLIYQYKDKLLEILKNLESDIQGKIKDFPPITLPPIKLPNTNIPSSTGNTPVPLAAGAVNVSAKWNNGRARSFTGFDPDDNKVEIRAGGSGGGTAAKIDGKGNATVTGDRRRLYCHYNNYNAQLTLTLTPNFKGSGDDASFKMRSRHNEGGPAGPSCGGNNFGGYGFSISQAGWDSKREPCHNTHDEQTGGKLPKPLVNGKSVRIRHSVFDVGGKVRQTGEIDYMDGAGFKKIMDIADNSPKPWMINSSLYNKTSYFWLRNNGTGSCTFSNVSIAPISSSNVKYAHVLAAQVMRPLYMPRITMS